MPEETLTLLATTDVHGRALDWDYLEDAPPATPGSLARISTLVDRIREEGNAVLLFDVGDTIQGTPLTLPVVHEGDDPHPMALALNHLGVHAACVGNHDLNFGLEHLESYGAACGFPLLAANLSGLPTVEAHTVLRTSVGSLGVVRIGVLGLSTPGSVIWDRPHLAGRVTAEGVVEAAASRVPELRAAGADVVVVLSHSGLGPSTTYGAALPWPENDTKRLIREVAGIDAVFLGHKHVEEVGHERCVPSGAAVPYVEPLFFGQRLGRIDLRLRRTARGRIEVAGSAPRSLPVAGFPPDPRIMRLLAKVHERTRGYVAQRVGTALEAIPARPVTEGPSPALDLVNVVQSETVARALAGAGGQPRRVLSATALFGEHTGLPAGELSIRDLSRLYRFENLLQAVEMTTAELLAYLEYNALGFGHSDVPAYNVDSLGAAGHDVAYLVDAGAPPGARISDLRIDGSAPDPAERFVVALSSYRASGGGGFPATVGKPLVYDNRVEVRDLLIDWFRRRGAVRLADIRRASWRVRDLEEIV